MLPVFSCISRSFVSSIQTLQRTPFLDHRIGRLSQLYDGGVLHEAVSTCWSGQNSLDHHSTCPRVSFLSGWQISPRKVHMKSHHENHSTTLHQLVFSDDELPKKKPVLQHVPSISSWQSTDPTDATAHHARQSDPGRSGRPIFS